MVAVAMASLLLLLLDDEADDDDDELLLLLDDAVELPCVGRHWRLVGTEN